MYPLLVPVTNDRFKMEVRKQSEMGKLVRSYDFVGQLEFSLKEILKSTKDGPIIRWCNIYAAWDSDDTSEDT
jgi:hypothetical protein